MTRREQLTWLFVALGVSVAVLLLGAIFAGGRDAQLPPATYYSYRVETPGTSVEAFANGVSCGATTVAESGFWTLQIFSQSPCSPASGDEVTFTLDGHATLDGSVWTPGGTAVVVPLAGPSVDPLVAATAGGPAFAIGNIGNASLDVTFPLGGSEVASAIGFEPLGHVNFYGNAEQRKLAVALPQGVAALPSPSASDEPPPRITSLFRLNAVTADGTATDRLDVPASLLARVIPEVVAMAGGDPDRVQLWRYDEASQRWIATACSTISGTVDTRQCTTDTLGLFAVVVVSPLG